MNTYINLILLVNYLNVKIINNKHLNIIKFNFSPKKNE